MRIAGWLLVALSLGCRADGDTYQQALDGMESSDFGRSRNAMSTFLDLRFSKGRNNKRPQPRVGPLPPHPEDLRVRRLMLSRIHPSETRHAELASETLLYMRFPISEPQLVDCAVANRLEQQTCMEAVLATALPENLDELARRLDTESLVIDFSRLGAQALPYFQAMATFESVERCRLGISGLTILRVEDRRLYGATITATAHALRNRHDQCRFEAVKNIGQHVGHQHLLIPALLDPSQRVAMLAKEIIDGTRPPTRTIDTPYD